MGQTIRVLSIVGMCSGGITVGRGKNWGKKLMQMTVFKNPRRMVTLTEQRPISSSSSSSQGFLKWPKQQRHHEDHYSQSKYEQYQSVL